MSDHKETRAQTPVTRINFHESDAERRNSLTTVLTTDIQQVVEAAKVVVETAAGTWLATKALDGNDKPPSPPAT